jgi:transcriptional regulator with XRE-family HTH domain
MSEVQEIAVGKRKASPEILWRLATNLRRLRKAREYTQDQLAEICGFTPSYIGDIEQQTVNITLANLEALATGLVCWEIELLLPIPEPGVEPENFLNALLSALTRPFGSIKAQTARPPL